MKKDSKFLSIVSTLFTAVFLLTGGIAVPILWRGFYYWQMDSLRLSYRSGFTPEVIREAFDQVMDYLVKGAPFGVGQLRWSQEGMAHFADCKALFRLDFLILAASTAVLLVLLALRISRKVRLHRFLDKGSCFWAVVLLAVVLGAVLVWALIDFESLFTAFHTVFFPGKTNWVFDWRLDQIILILPEDFWARAAILVGAVAFGGGVVLALIEAACHHFAPTPTVYQELKDMGGRRLEQ